MFGAGMNAMSWTSLMPPCSIRKLMALPFLSQAHEIGTAFFELHIAANDIDHVGAG
jgi:hypothetical protein